MHLQQVAEGRAALNSDGFPVQKVESRGPTTETVMALAQDLAAATRQASRAITEVNAKVRMLSFNASIEAARAGGVTGQAFQVVATGMRELSDRTEDVARRMTADTADTLQQIQWATSEISSTMRGRRLTDVARTLAKQFGVKAYERERDVMLLAGEDVVIEALTTNSDRVGERLRDRLRMWKRLSPYFLDFWVVDREGEIRFSAESKSYRTQGLNVLGEGWFLDALGEWKDDEKRLPYPEARPELLMQNGLILCAPILDPRLGEPVGVAVGHFDWCPMTRQVLSGADLAPHERSRTEVVIVDTLGRVLGSTIPREIGEGIWLPDFDLDSANKPGHTEVVLGGRTFLVAFAPVVSEGVGRTDWRVLVLQDHHDVARLRRAA